MSAPVRFLAVVALGWIGLRAVTLDALPGFTFALANPAEATALPPIAKTEFPPIPPLSSASPQQPQFAALAPGWPANYPPPLYYSAHPRIVSAPAQVYAPAPLPRTPAWQLASLPPEAPQFYSPIQPLDDWDLASLSTLPQRRSRPAAASAIPAPAFQQPLDRLQMTSWALLRGNSSPGALASGGTLGGSQGGARLTYHFNRWLAASVRTTSPLGGSRGAEVAAGVRVIPFQSIPIAITAERRQAISPHGGGRSAFALFAEGGLYRQPMPLEFSLDAYLQAGVVGFNRRDLFADGALAFTRPVYGRLSAGFGLWGGVQPGVYRVDAGPRLSIRVRDNIHAHVDWRQRVAGTASPGSGPALTLAADF